MKKTTLFLFIGILAFFACRRENVPASDNCHITQVANSGIAIIDLNRDAQERITAVQYILDAEFSFSVSYTGNQKITETNATSPVYEKKVFTYDAAGKILNIKSYYENGNPVIDEEMIFTYNGNEISADTLYLSGVLSQVTAYSWQNGNLIKLVIDGNRIIHRGYDPAKAPVEGDAAWTYNQLENKGYYPATTNRMIYEYEEGNGDPVAGNFNYTYDSNGKITGMNLGFTGQLSFIWQCN